MTLSISNRFFTKYSKLNFQSILKNKVSKIHEKSDKVKKFEKPQKILKTCNSKEFSLIMKKMSGNENYSVYLNKKSIIEVECFQESGDILFFIFSENGKQIYSGQNPSQKKFTIFIPKSGLYKISVWGNKAIGSISFKFS